MTTPPPLPQARNRILLSGAWSEGGFVSVLVTQRSDGRIEFDPNVSGARAFVVEHDELITALLKWGRG